MGLLEYLLSCVTMNIYRYNNVIKKKCYVSSLLRAVEWAPMATPNHCGPVLQPHLAGLQSKYLTQAGPIRSLPPGINCIWD